MFICNICGRDLKLSGSVSAITAHLSHKHPEIKAKLEEIEKQHGDTSLTSDTNNVKKRPFGLHVGAKSSKDLRDDDQKVRKMKQSQPSKDSKTTSTSVKSRKLSSADMQTRAHILQMVGLNLPLTHFETKWHKLLVETTVKAAHAGATVSDLQISNQEMRRTIFSASKTLREELKDRITENKIICGVIESYMPNPMMTYSTFRVQWIEDFSLVSAVLVTLVSKGQHRKEDFDTKLLEWDVSASMKFLVTNNPTLGNHYMKSSKYGHVYSLDYILQQVAAKAFQGVLGMEGLGLIECDNDDEQEYTWDSTNRLLSKVRELMSYFHECIEAKNELLKIKEQLQESDDTDDKPLDYLVQDVTHKWWPLQTMLEHILGLREAITIYVGRLWSRCNGDDSFRPVKLTESEWEQIDDLCLILSPLRYARHILSGYCYPTAPLVPLVVHLVYRGIEEIHLNKERSVITRVTGEMLKCMDSLVGDFCSRKYQDGNSNAENCQVHMNKALMYAHALDPRFKRLIVFPTEIQELVWEGILEEMVNLSPTLEVASSKSPESKVEKDDISERQSACSAEVDSLFKLYAHRQSMSPNKHPGEFHAEEWNRKCEVELKKYRECDGIEPKLQTDVLRQWWRENASNFPTLFRLVNRFFTIAATSAPPGRVFSLASDAVIHRQCAFGADEMMHFLRENASFLREGRFLG